ncbi:MAG: methionyl-tRNA formyltransferase [Defluviitaleaceae bacterium]|nr:methionyl-tRNA formyltransferase [Defluviitaleaceae bacterium]
MNIVFMGTPAFAVSSLNALLSRHNVVAVFTQPDRPSGRGYKLQTSPVKDVALEHGIPVFQPQTLRLSESREIREQLKNLGADVFVVAAYGLLLPKGVLAMPPKGCINVHASLLPKYRGASPIHSALLNGDSETGITIMHMDIELDTGDIILQKSLPITKDEHFPQLHDRMAELGGEALLEALEQIENDTAARIPQGENFSYSPIIKKTDGQINWADCAEKIINQTRALDPWPSCYTMHNGQPLKIWRVEETEAPSQPTDTTNGTILAANPTDGLIVKCGDTAIKITELQAVGKKRMPATDYLRGQKINVGELF